VLFGAPFDALLIQMFPVYGIVGLSSPCHSVDYVVYQQLLVDQYCLCTRSVEYSALPQLVFHVGYHMLCSSYEGACPPPRTHTYTDARHCNIFIVLSLSLVYFVFLQSLVNVISLFV
jgi:hypothetical protein